MFSSSLTLPLSISLPLCLLFKLSLSCDTWLRCCPLLKFRASALCTLIELSQTCHHIWLWLGSICLTTLSEIRQTQRENIVWVHLHELSRRGKYLETESRTGVAGCWGWGGMGSYCLTGIELTSGMMKVWGIGNGDGYTTLWMWYFMPLNCPLKKRLKW